MNGDDKDEKAFYYMASKGCMHAWLCIEVKKQKEV